MQNNKINIYETISRYIDEITAAKKRGIILPSVLEKIEKYIDKNYYIQFSDINKLGINPKSHYNTPIGIYAYPLTSDIYEELENNQIPFASDRNYIVLFKASPEANLLKVHYSYDEEERKFIGIEEKDYEEFKKFILTSPKLDKFEKYSTDLRLVRVAYKKSKDKTKFPTAAYSIFKNIEKDSYRKEPSNYFWNVTRVLSKQNSKLWAAMLNLFYDGVVDYGTSMIHESEPEQAVFFTKKYLQVVEVFHNTMTPKHFARREKVADLKKIKEKWFLLGDIVRKSDKYVEEYEKLLLQPDIPESIKKKVTAQVEKIRKTYYKVIYSSLTRIHIISLEELERYAGNKEQQYKNSIKYDNSKFDKEDWQLVKRSMRGVKQ